MTSLYTLELPVHANEFFACSVPSGKAYKKKTYLMEPELGNLCGQSCKRLSPFLSVFSVQHYASC